MPARDEYAPGTPSWVDLQSPDVAASVAFYGALFGWTADVSTDPAAGGYATFLLGGAPVAGVGPQMNLRAPPAWSTYVSVADADATIALAEASGATTLLAPMDVLEEGRMAVFADPLGAVIAVWQPKAHRGAAVVNEPGSFGWNELATSDIEAAKAFYGRVFGWEGATQESGPMIYTEWKLDGASVGGMIEIGPQFPPGMPPCWMVYFMVDDCDAAAATVTDLGGKVMVPPMDIPPGRFSLVADPHGAAFYVMKAAAAAAAGA
ncbi:MAG TPA: VOC family protein [Acidimicrobiales bacterium]|jgi:hypothetical protein|nr:VOC family protein [Acidimicrobiales bacterium]